MFIKQHKKVLFSALVLSLLTNSASPVQAMNNGTDDNPSPRMTKAKPKSAAAVPATTKKKGPPSKGKQKGAKGKQKGAKSKKANDDVDALLNAINDPDYKGPLLQEAPRPAAVPATSKKNGKSANQQAVIKSQDQIDVEVCEEAQRVYDLINTKWEYVPEQEGGKIVSNDKFWKGEWLSSRAYKDGKICITNVPTLIFKESYGQICEGLDDLVQNHASMECTLAMQVVQHFCIRKVLGDQTYKSAVRAWFAHRPAEWKDSDFFNEFPREFMTRVSGVHASPGSFTHLTNVPEYRIFKSHGNAGGDNVFCSAHNFFLCFYPGDKGDTLEGFEKHYFDEYMNPEGMDCDDNTADIYQQLRTLYQANPQGFYEERRREQEKIDYHEFFDADKFKALIKSKQWAFKYGL
jgi:hypothetical protein